MSSLKRKRAENAPDDNGGYDVLMAQDPDRAYYGLILSIDTAVGMAAQDEQRHLSIDAARVDWYRALNVVAPPALDGVAVASGCRIFEMVLLEPQFAFLDNFLQLTSGHALEESSWWLITPGVYNFRNSVRIEEFLPVAGDANPASLALPNSRHGERYVLPRLIVPRQIFAQLLFSLRELF